MGSAHIPRPNVAAYSILVTLLTLMSSTSVFGSPCALPMFVQVPPALFVWKTPTSLPRYQRDDGAYGSRAMALVLMSGRAVVPLPCTLTHARLVWAALTLPQR